MNIPPEIIRLFITPRDTVKADTAANVVSPYINADRSRLYGYKRRSPKNRSRSVVVLKKYRRFLYERLLRNGVGLAFILIRTIRVDYRGRYRVENIQRESKLRFQVTLGRFISNVFVSTFCVLSDETNQHSAKLFNRQFAEKSAGHSRNRGYVSAENPVTVTLGDRTVYKTFLRKNGHEYVRTRALLFVNRVFGHFAPAHFVHNERARVNQPFVGFQRAVVRTYVRTHAIITFRNFGDTSRESIVRRITNDAYGIVNYRPRYRPRKWYVRGPLLRPYAGSTL